MVRKCGSISIQFSRVFREKFYRIFLAGIFTCFSPYDEVLLYVGYDYFMFMLSFMFAFLSVSLPIPPPLLPLSASLFPFTVPNFVVNKRFYFTVETKKESDRL